MFIMLLSSRCPPIVSRRSSVVTVFFYRSVGLVVFQILKIKKSVITFFFDPQKKKRNYFSSFCKSEGEKKETKEKDKGTCLAMIAVKATIDNILMGNLPFPPPLVHPLSHTTPPHISSLFLLFIATSCKMRSTLSVISILTYLHMPFMDSLLVCFCAEK